MAVSLAGFIKRLPRPSWLPITNQLVIGIQAVITLRGHTGAMPGYWHGAPDSGGPP